MEKVKCPLCKLKYNTNKTITDDWDRICINCLADIERTENKIKAYNYDSSDV